MFYKGILNQDRGALTLAEDVRRGVYSDNPEFFLSELETWWKHRTAKAIREVSIYEPNGEEADAITVYMRCLEAVGVDTAQEAEHVRQVMRDAIAKSEARK